MREHPVARRWRDLLAEHCDVSDFRGHFMSRMFLEFIPKYSTGTTYFEFLGSLDWEYEVRFYSPIVELSSGGELVHLKNSGGMNGDLHLADVREGASGSGFRCVRERWSQIDVIFARLTRNYADIPMIYIDGSKISNGGSVWAFSPRIWGCIPLSRFMGLSLFVLSSLLRF